MQPHLLNLGTRGSKLALQQARMVADLLQRSHDGLRVELRIITTSGDKLKDAPLAKFGGKGLFVKEIEEALLAGAIDVAVHSMKDVPASLAPGLAIGAVSEREDPRDALLLPNANGNRANIASVDQLNEQLTGGATVGTSSLRRKTQLLSQRPDLHVAPLRGNLDTRLRKLREGEVDAIILAAAGLHRMGWGDSITAYLDAALCLPAIGQGALGIEIRQHDAEVLQLVAVLDDPAAAQAVAAERAFSQCMGASCQAPIAGFAEVGKGGDVRELHLRGLVASLDGKSVIRGERRGPVDDAAEIGSALGEDILSRGGRQLLDEILAAIDSEGSA